MKFKCLCFVILRSLMVLSGKIDEGKFTSCDLSGYSFDFKFNCASLDDSLHHTDYFDNHVLNDTCEVKSWSNQLISKSFLSASLVKLTNCKIPIIPRRFLQRLGHAKKIDLDRSKIKSIDNGMFSNDSSLTEVTLSRNALTELPGYLFAQTSNIMEVDFSYNMISNIDRNTFRGPTKRLRVINLSHNNIETIDKTLFMYSLNLTELNLGYNFIKHFQIKLFNLRELKLLRFDNNKIERLDCNIFELTANKIFIDVDHNHIQEIEFNCDAHIDSIQLSINNNRLTTLTFPKVNFLDGLTTLYAAHNRIEHITFQRNFLQLTEIHLNANNLKDILVWNTTMFPKLTRLNINGNLFNCSYLDMFLKKLPKTIQLDEMQLEGFKTSLRIHGINCNDDANNGVPLDPVADDAHKYIWCFMAFLTLAVVILWGLKIVQFKKYRSDLPMALL